MRATHYSYLSGPENMREPTGLYDLSRHTIRERRTLVHTLLRNGELLAVAPFGVVVEKMADLRRALKWLGSGREPKSGS